MINRAPSVIGAGGSWSRLLAGFAARRALLLVARSISTLGHRVQVLRSCRSRSPSLPECPYRALIPALLGLAPALPVLRRHGVPQRCERPIGEGAADAPHQTQSIGEVVERGEAVSEQFACSEQVC